MTWVKICGMTNLEDALVAVDAGADALGFVFYEKSPRCVSVETAQKIVEQLPASVEKVGVFVDHDGDAIHEFATKIGLTAVQLHGKGSLLSLWDDPQPALERVGVSKIIAMVPGNVLSGEDNGIMISDRVKKGLFAVLVDNQLNGSSGGTGSAFDWKASHEMVLALSVMVPIILAGGLTDSNVADAMRIFQPFGVDVASGVEARPGKKDPEKVRAFVKAVRKMERKAS
jgi:phosphoribosylanthranilate isomerase